MEKMSSLLNSDRPGIRPRGSNNKTDYRAMGKAINFHQRSNKYEDFLKTASKSISNINLYGKHPEPKNLQEDSKKKLPPKLDRDTNETLRPVTIPEAVSPKPSTPVSIFKRYQTPKELVSIQFPGSTNSKRRPNATQQIFRNPAKPSLPEPESKVEENKILQDLSKKIQEIETIYWRSIKCRPKSQQFSLIWKH
jgi:hypothetical protein